MNTLTASVCTRCGKQRVIVRTYDEVVGTSTVSYTETSCPDKLCQELVEDKLQQDLEKRVQMSASTRFGTNPRNKKKVN
jgi:hypothetical protein